MASLPKTFQPPSLASCLKKALEVYGHKEDDSDCARFIGRHIVEIGGDGDYSLFDLYCSVMRWRKCLLEKPSERYWNPIMFSRIIQRTLLEESGPYKMANSRRLIQRHSSIEDMSFDLSSWNLGKVFTSSNNPEDILLAQKILATTKGNGNGINSIFDLARWRKVLEKAWEWDRDSFVLFDFDKNGAPNPDAHSGEANESETGLSIFLTLDMRTGIAPTGIQKDDLVCDFSPEKTDPCIGIVRIHEGKQKVLGRAITLDISYSAEDISTIPMVMTPNDLSISVDIPILQALTCPLNYLSSDFSELLPMVQ